jgi:hypothetical protein
MAIRPASGLVELRVDRPIEMQRAHVAIRLALLLALGAIGCSSLYWVLYVGLPAVAALLIANKGADRYFSEDGPGVLRALRWIAAAYAYLWLLTDAPPTSEGRHPVELRVETGGVPTPSSALFRLLSSLPAVLVLAVLAIVASIFWPIGAVAILVSRRVPPAIADFLALTLRYQFRLFAYHLSLVDRYPSLELPGTPAPRSDAA